MVKRITVESPGGGELPDDVGGGAGDKDGTEGYKYVGGGSVVSTITTPSVDVDIKLIASERL